MTNNSTKEESCEFCELVQRDIEKTRIEGKKKPKLTFTGKVLLGVSGASFVALCAVTTPFLLPALRKVTLPYVPATDTQVSNVLKLLQRKSGSLIDLGSGDGRIVIAAAKAGFKAEGVELNPWLVWYSRFSALRQGVNSSSTFYTKDLWKMDLSQFENVVVFGVGQMMLPLEQKLRRELSTGSQVIACRFHLPNAKPVTSVGKGIDTVWLYTSKSLLESQSDTKQAS